MKKLFHDHGGKLFVLHRGGDTHVAKEWYTRWFCRECGSITLVPKEMIPA